MAAMKKMEMVAVDKRAAFEIRVGLLLRQIGEPEA